MLKMVFLVFAGIGLGLVMPLVGGKDNIDSLLTLIGILITAVVAVMGLENTTRLAIDQLKSNREESLRQARSGSIAQFRQEWIRELRRHIVSMLSVIESNRDYKAAWRELYEQQSLYVGIVPPIEPNARRKAQKDYEEMEKKIDENVKQKGFFFDEKTFQERMDLFVLHMNPEKDNHNLWLEKLNRLEEAANSANVAGRGVPYYIYQHVRANFVEFSRYQLKIEWERTKSDVEHMAKRDIKIPACILRTRTNKELEAQFDKEASEMFQEMTNYLVKDMPSRKPEGTQTK